MIKTQALKSVVFAAIAAGLSSVGFAAEYWVSPTGSGTGREDDPMSLASALAIAAAAEVPTAIHVLTGVYTPAEPIVLANATSIIGAGSNETHFVGTALTTSMFVLSHSDACLSSLTITNVAASTTSGGGVNMTAGLVMDCRITDCHTIVSSNGSGGGGAFLKGGLLTGCTFDHCSSDTKGATGNAVRMQYGGVVSNCVAWACDGGYNAGNAVPSTGAGIISLIGQANSPSYLFSTKVYNNNKGTIPGIYAQSGSFVVNCLVYGNVGTARSAGIYNDGGSVYYCTVYGNTIGNGKTGSGFYQKSGTTKNCIFHNNGSSPKDTDSCTIVAGVFENNLLDRAVANYPDNLVGDPLFTDPDNGDFHLLKSASPAVGLAVPIEGCCDDIEGLARDAMKPTAGCYEYDSSAAEFSIDVRTGASDVGQGSAVRAEVAVEGGEIDDCTYEWFLDGGTVAACTEPIFEMENLALASHSLRLVATPKDGRPKIVKDCPDFVYVHPRKVYVNETGNGTYPYGTPETATNSIEEALAALWTDASGISEVSIGEGLFAIESTVSLSKMVKVTGCGWDKSFVTCEKARAFVVANASASVSALSVTNSAYGFRVEAGSVVDCRAVDCDDAGVSTSENRGGGFFVQGGSIVGCVAENCILSANSYAAGAGLSLSGGGGIASNCVVRGCRVTVGRVAGSQGHGACIEGAGVVLTHCRFENNGDCTSAILRGGALSCYCSGGSAKIEWCTFIGNEGKARSTAYFENALVRNCLFADNNGGNGAVDVELRNSTLDNCTIAGACHSLTSVCAMANSKICNSILACDSGEYEFADGVTIEHSCCPALEEGVDGNTAKDPKFKSVARGDYRLKGGSPCIDTGDNARWDGYVDPVDLNGEPRIRYGIVDMGCYENCRSGLMLILR